MGLVHSGAVAETALLNKADRRMFDQEVLREHGIELALRYRDDVLIYGTDMALFKVWYEKYQEFGEYFCMKVEEVSRSSLTWLNLNISINNDHSLSFEPFLKPTALVRPLSLSSIHSRHVHKSWPVQYLKHCRLLSSTHLCKSHQRMS